MQEALEQEVKKHVTQLFEQADTTKLFYHNYQHTAEVVDRIEVLGIDLSFSDLTLLKIAGWFHDVGYLYAYDKHEERGMLIAANYLKNKQVDAAKIKLITDCIQATEVGFEPRTLLEKIIKDADIGYGTTERFMETGALLRKEWKAFLERTYTDKNWEILQDNFLSGVHFYTPMAQGKYGPVLQENIARQQKRIS